MKLTDNEKREILKLIEVDKLLPDKYRSLLFDDKREVELVWNGKTSEVTNIVLPFQVIEQVEEPRKSKPLIDANRGKAFAQKSGWNNKLMLSSRYEKWKDITAISGTAGLSPRYYGLPRLGTSQRNCGITLRFNRFEFVSDFVPSDPFELRIYT